MGKKRYNILKHDVSYAYRRSRGKKAKVTSTTLTEEGIAALKAVSETLGITQSAFKTWAIEELLESMGFLKHNQRRTASDSVKGIEVLRSNFPYHARAARRRVKNQP